MEHIPRKEGDTQWEMEPEVLASMVGQSHSPTRSLSELPEEPRQSAVGSPVSSVFDPKEELAKLDLADKQRYCRSLSAYS